ncbi:MAG: hypothetical protein ACYC1M_00860 [Armatimonadota bacterium]
MKKRILKGIGILLVLLILNGIRLHMMQQYPVMSVNDVSSELTGDAYFHTSDGLQNLKTGKTYSMNKYGPIVWDARQERVLVGEDWIDDKSGNSRPMIRLMTGDSDDWLLEYRKYDFASSPHRWSCDTTKRYVIASPYLLDLKSRKISKPPMPGTKAGASSIGECFWFCNGKGLVLWNARTKQVQDTIPIPNLTSQVPWRVGSFAVSPNGKYAVVPVSTIDFPFIEPIGLVFAVVNLQTKSISTRKLYNFFVWGNPVGTYFADDEHVILNPGGSYYLMRVTDGKTWFIKKAWNRLQYRINTVGKSPDQ